MNCFRKLPAELRITVTALFFVAAVVVGILGHPSVVLAVAAMVLLASGAWRLTALRTFMLTLILIPLLIGFLLAGFDWHHPFVGHYVAGLFSIIAVLLCMDAVRLEEWIQVMQKSGGRRFQDLSAIVIGTAVGIISLSLSIQEQRAFRKLARIYRWKAKSPAAIFLDNLSFPFYTAVESHEFVDEALRRWGARQNVHSQMEDENSAGQFLGELKFGNSLFTARLIDVYNFPRFMDVLCALSVQPSFLKSWEQMTARLAKESTVFYVNGHSKRLVCHLLQDGLTVTVFEQVQDLYKELCRMQPEYGPRLKIVTGSLLGSSLGRFDNIVFHQNAFLETINETAIEVLFERLACVCEPRSWIYFTYPAITGLPSDGIILTGEIPGVGRVDYRYSGYECVDERASMLLSYSVTKEHESYCVRTQSNFRMPDLSNILAVAEQAGFDHTPSTVPHPAFLFPGEQVFIELVKR